MEGKKISFGFMKTKKVEKPVIEEKKDFIECLEEKAIKVVGGEQVEENEPLVIPMKPNTLITAERLKEIAEKVESGLDELMPMPIKEEKVEIKTEPAENETLDQMAVRELLQEAKKEIKVEQQELTVPIPAKPVIDGEKESTLQDYESVPIQDFGMAMLRGMGWTANKEQLAKYKAPTLRPKGLGLGADKVISDKQKKKTSNKDGKDEELSIVKNSFVKIIAGKHSGYYGKVVSLDEENGRVMVDITMKKETVSLSEFMMQPVTKAEFDKESKVINSGAYEEYKKNENVQNQKPSRNESPKNAERQIRDSPKVNTRDASSSQRYNDVSDNRRQERKETREDSRRGYDKGSNGRDKNKQERSRQNSSSEDDNRRKKEYRRDSSSEDRDRRSRKDKPRRHSSSSEDRDSRKNKEKSRRKSFSSDERDSRKKKDKSRRESSSEDRDRSNRRKKDKSRRDSSAEDRDKRKSEKDKKRYSSNESLESISDSERKKSAKNRRRKDSSDSESDDNRKNKRDIDKKRKGKKKKRDRDRSPNYKKHRKDKRKSEKDKKRYSSNESLESISDSERKKSKKNRRRKDSSDSESDDNRKNKRDIDKKRKGKKKKRDRDRSPNYKKHRK